MSLKPPIPFASAPFERAAHHRTDTDWLKAAKLKPTSLFMLMYKGKVLCEDNGASIEDVIPGQPISQTPRLIAWLTSDQLPTHEPSQSIFLSEDKGIVRFSINLPVEFELENSALSQHVLGDVRAIAGGISPEDAQFAATSAAIFNWHRRHSFCANCGHATHITEAGWKRTCPSCEAEHFPRIDPVAIMLAVKGDKCLMGRQAHWAEGMYSCLAGFVEPGETIEQAGARELFEEAGVKATGRIEYLCGQPWPFPTNLMIGMIMEVENETLVVDKNELETARWFDRAEAQQVLDGTHPTITAPANIAIAHHVLKAWLEADNWKN